MSEPIVRRWIFNVTDSEGSVSCVDNVGAEICADDAIEFVGTDAEAEREGGRRADLWEVKYNALCLRIERESRGKAAR